MAAIEGRQRKRGSGRRRGSRRKKCHHTSRISRRDESSRSSTVRSATTVSQSSGTSVTNAVSLASRSPQSSVRETSVGLSTHSARSPGRDDTSPARQSPRSSVRGSESFPHFTRGEWIAVYTCTGRNIMFVSCKVSMGQIVHFT